MKIGGNEHLALWNQQQRLFKHAGKNEDKATTQKAETKRMPFENILGTFMFN